MNGILVFQSSLNNEHPGKKEKSKISTFPGKHGGNFTHFTRRFSKMTFVSGRVVPQPQQSKTTMNLA